MEAEQPSEKEVLDTLLEEVSEKSQLEAMAPSALPPLESVFRGSEPGVEEQASPRREVLQGVKLRVRVELGRTRMPLGEVTRSRDPPGRALVARGPIAAQASIEPRGRRFEVLQVRGIFRVAIGRV